MSSVRYGGRRGHTVLSEVWGHDSSLGAGLAVPTDLGPPVLLPGGLRLVGRLDVAPSASPGVWLDVTSPERSEALRELQQRDIGGLCRLPGMRGPGSSRRRGRRGRRTAAMIRAARERIQDLFSLAETEVRRSPSNLSQRYVLLARKIGMRYNVRLLREYRDVYCRGCSAFWIEGRSVRTRIRRGGRTQTCLHCGRVRRVPIKHRSAARVSSEEEADRAVRREQAVLIDDGLDVGPESDLEDEEGP